MKNKNGTLKIFSFMVCLLLIQGQMPGPWAEVFIFQSGNSTFNRDSFGVICNGTNCGSGDAAGGTQSSTYDSQTYADDESGNLVLSNDSSSTSFYNVIGNGAGVNGSSRKSGYSDSIQSSFANNDPTSTDPTPAQTITTNVSHSNVQFLVEGGGDMEQYTESVGAIYSSANAWTQGSGNSITSGLVDTTLTGDVKTLAPTQVTGTTGFTLNSNSVQTFDENVMEKVGSYGLTKGDHTLYEGLVGYTTGDDLSIMQGGNLSSVYSDNGSVRIVGNDDEHDSNGNLVSDGHGGYKSSTYNVQTSIGLNTAQYSSTDGKPISGTSIEASDSLDTSDPSDPDEHMDKTYNDPVIPSYTTTTMSNYAGKLESVSSTTSADNAYTNGQDPYGNTFYSVDDMIGGIGSAANTKDGISALGKSTNENTMDTNQGQVIDYEDVCGSDPDCDS